MQSHLMSPRVRLHPPEGRRFLPEGLQSVIHDGSMHLAGVCIQLGKQSKEGGLWFHDLNSGQTTFAAIPDGRPGWFRPTSEANTYVVGLEDRLALYKVEGEKATLVKVLATAGGVDSPRIMVNDGCVAPNGTDIICGFKDFQFDTKAQLAFTLCYRQGDFQRLMAQPETCANGNAFVSIDGALHVLHVDSAVQKLFALPYPPQSPDQTPKVLIDFKDRNFFQRFGAENLFHESLIPDGICQWRVKATQQDKIIVAIFDPRTDALRDGLALQFDVTNGRVALEAAYRTPKSPRVTHPAIVQVAPGAVPQIWATTASEGLVEALGVDAETDSVGVVFMCTADPDVTGLVPDSGAFEICNYALQLS